MQLFSNFEMHVVNHIDIMIAGTHRRDHIKPVLAQLHWLPIRARVTFKIATVVFKIRWTQRPSDLADMIKEYLPRWMLRFSSQPLRKEPTFQTDRSSFVPICSGPALEQTSGNHNVDRHSRIIEAADENCYSDNHILSRWFSFPHPRYRIT